MDYATVQKNFTTFKQMVESNQDPKKINELLGQLKIALVHLNTPANTKDDNPQVIKESILARDILEVAALYSIKQRDIRSFERFYAQLTIFYNDYKKSLQPSALQYNIIGLNLMKLLATHNTPLFHSELELIPCDILENPFIKYPLLVEKSITEGSYQRVMSSRSQVPSEHYLVFVDLLSDSMREDIASCTEKSFKYLTIKDAQTLLRFDPAQLNEFIKKRGWKVQGDQIIFNSGPAVVEIPSHDLIRQTLHYAKELERIV